MISILISYLIILYITFSLGDFFISLYNKICKRQETYSLLEIFILGICFIAVLLSAFSIWIPINEYVLAAFFIVSFIHWGFNKNRLSAYLSSLKFTYNSLSFKQKLFIGLSLSIFLIYLLFPEDFYDSIAYHRQQILCNEQYSVVPGFGNIEDRFGFNSNYFLLSSLFSFRFLFGEAIYGSVQSLLFILLTTWILANLFLSRYSIIYIFLTLLLYIIILTSSYMFTDSNTDIIPLLFVFYYIVKTVLSPGWLIKQPLLSVLLPIILITFKLSSIIFCLLSLGVLIYLMKQKQGKVILFFLTVAFCAITFWCVRNVIITGYLVYPLDSIDLFSFDWKMPKGTVMLERAHVYYWAKYIYDVKYIYYITNFRSLFISFHTSDIFTNMALYLTILASPLMIVYAMIKKIKVDNGIYYAYWIALLCIIFGIISAPDFRFINGYIFGCTFIVYYILFLIFKQNNLFFPRLGKTIASVYLLLTVLFVISNVYFSQKLDGKDLLKTCYLPKRDKPEIEYTKYQLGSIPIYLSDDEYARVFDLFPATSSKGLPFEPFMGYKIQSIKTIEPRGNSFQDGFRTKKEYIDIINKNVGLYKEKYLTRYQDFYPKDF